MLLVLLMVPAISACTRSWTEDYNLGAAALKQARFDEAERYLQAAANAARDTKNVDGVSMSTVGLARVHMGQGEYSQARPLFEEAIRLYTNEHGRNSAEVAETLVELAACLYHQELFKQAEPLCLEAIKIETSLPKRNVVTLGTAYNNLAEICKSRNEDEEAESYYQSAVEVYRAADSSDVVKQNLIDTYCNLAMLYKRDARYDMARGTAELALQTQKSLSKPNDLAMASVLNTVASIDRAQFNNESATNHYKEAIALLLRHEQDKVGSPFEESLCDTLDSYADLEADERDFEIAEQTYKKAIKHCVKSRGPNHPCVAERLVDLASLYRRTARLGDAEVLLRKAISIYSNAYDSDSPIVINTINDLSAVYLEEKKYAQANRLYADYLPKLVKQLGPVHPHVADVLDNWALVAQRSDDPKQAESLRARAKDIRLALTRK